MDIFTEIADERRVTADLLASLSPDQLAAQSLCAAWTVRDVGAHLLMPLVTSTPQFLRAMIGSRMSFERTNVALTAGVARRSTQEIIDGLRANAGSRFTPPGLGPQAPLTDLLVHGQDMRRPLGVSRTIPAERQIEALDFLCAGAKRGFVPQSRLSGLRFEADDIAWSYGEGELVRGPAEAIMMAVTGRRVALVDLTGTGATLLSDRTRDA